MAVGKRKLSFVSLIWNALKVNKVFIGILPLTISLIIINAILTVKLKDFSSTLFTNIHTHNRQRDFMVKHFTIFITSLITHYAISASIDYFRATISIIFFKTYLRDAVRETTNMSYGDFHSNGTGKNQENILRSSRAAYDCSSIAILDIPSCIIYMSIYVYHMAPLFNIKVGSVFFLAIILSFGFASFVALVVNRCESKCLKLFNNSISNLSDILSNYDIIKAFNKEDSEAKHFGKSLDPFVNNTKSFFAIKEWLSFLQKVSIMAPHLTIVLLFIADYDIGFDYTQALFYNLLFMEFRKHVMLLRDHSFNLSKRLSELDCRFNIAVEEDKESCKSITSFQDSIVLEDVDLYAGNDIVQTHLNLVIKKGDKIAITGVNGAGKSTLLKFLLRFHKKSGNVFIDGVEIEELKKSSIRDLIAYIPQDPHIFNNTVMYNLCYAQNIHDEEEIFKICKQYGVDEFFSNMKDGYFTMAGENGKFLSGGQKQRINFLRAVIKNSPIIVLDEPTANMDKKSESEIMTTFMALSAGKTILAIVHNPDLLSHFDRIFYFTNESVQVYNSYEEFKVSK